MVDNLLPRLWWSHVIIVSPLSPQPFFFSSYMDFVGLVGASDLGLTILIKLKAVFSIFIFVGCCLLCVQHLCENYEDITRGWL